MDAGTVLFVAAVLACPLLMLFMHRGGHHGHGAGAHAGHGTHGGLGDDRSPGGHASLDELRRRQEELAAEIRVFEAREQGAEEKQESVA